MPTPRRRPWGQLWATAPWDGKARVPDPIRIPATSAALIDTPPPLGTLSLRRWSWGRLLVAAPWRPRQRPRSTTPTTFNPEVFPMPVADMPVGIPSTPFEPSQAPQVDSTDGSVDFNFTTTDDSAPTLRIAPPPEVLS